MDGADAATLAQDGPRTALPDPVTVGTGSASVVDAVAKTDAPQDAADTFITGTGTADVATEKVATNILNGAQVDAAKALVEEAAAGLIPVASARAMLIAFYGLTAEQVDAIMAPLAGFGRSKSR